MALISRNLLHARPQELGKIKIGGLGAERTSGRGNTFRMPEKFDHFLVTTRVRGDDGNFIRDDVIHSHPDVGDRPTSLSGVLMYDRPDENFHSEMAVYKGKSKDGKLSTCDGDEVLFLVDVNASCKKGQRKPCFKANGRECACKPYGRLHLQLWASPFTMGYHVFRTTSWESTNNIQSALEEIYARLGTCLGAPVKLVLYPSEDRRPDGVSISHKVGLVLAVSLEDTARQIAATRQYATIASGAPLRQLAAGVRAELDERDLEEAELIAAEYFPEVTETQAHVEDVAAALRSSDPMDPSTPIEETPPPPPPPPSAEKVIPGEDPLAGDEGQTPEKPQLDEKLKPLNAKYFAMLAERQMTPDADRKPFQARLAKQGLITDPSCSKWGRQDYLSAIAEVEKIPLPDETDPDEDLFKD